MAVKIIIDLQAKQGHGDALAQLFKELLPDTRSYDGCIEVGVFRDLDDPDRMSIVESFASREAYQRYFDWRVESGSLAALAEQLADAPQPRFLEDIGA